MSDKKFKENKITINKVYTKRGDKGLTDLIGEKKVRKDDLRLSAFGEIDELNSFVGSCSVYIKEYHEKELAHISFKLDAIQHELFNLGNMLATADNCNYDNMPRIDNESISFLEDSIDTFNKDLDSLTSFVLPGGDELNVRFHIARTVCRRCERLVVNLSTSKKIDQNIIIFLNRLSDLLFVLGRYVNHVLNNKEVTWNPNFKKI
tara:strand:+ start:1369 stop:1983 length:615 start_codon:yes stop_codon:yes gene_type:complete